MVNGLHSAMSALDSYLAFVKMTEDLLRDGKIQQRCITQKFTPGKTLVGEDLIKWVAHGKNSIERMLSFVKEMSPPTVISATFTSVNGELSKV